MSLPRLMLKGRTAAITGASSGIGRAIALVYAREGANIICHYEGNAQSARDAASLVREINNNNNNNSSSTSRAISIPGDIRAPETSTAIVEAAVREFGTLDIAVANAGICRFQSILDIEPDEVRAHVDINLNGAYFFVQAAARQMKAQFDAGKAGGSIIGISSILALCGSANQTHYAPTKAGILSLMQSCAVALGQYQIRCNAILPGTTETALLTGELAEGSERRKSMLERTPLGRFGKPEEIAEPALFLASDMSSYMTGGQLLIDGGSFVMQ